MQIPHIDKGLLAKLGAAVVPTTAPIIPTPVIDFGIEINKPKPEPPKALTSDECVNLFGAREAVLMNFIPQMLTALALEQAEGFIKYCRDNRLCEYKRHNWEMRKCIDEYNYELRTSYGRSWFAYQKYLERLRKTVEFDLFQCWCTFTNEAARQYVGHPHKEIPARVAFVRMILTFVEDFDKNMDKVIAERINAPCSRKQNPYCFLISVLCMDIAETFGQQMQITDTMTLCVKVLANWCHAVVDAIMAEEDAAEGSKS